MELKGILLLDKNKKVYNTHYEIGDIISHNDGDSILHYLIEDIRVEDNIGVYSFRVLEDNNTFLWDVEIVDKTRKIKRVA